MDAMIKADVRLSFRDFIKYSALIRKHHFAPFKKQFIRYDLIIIFFVSLIPFEVIIAITKHRLIISDLIEAAGLSLVILIMSVVWPRFQSRERIERMFERYLEKAPDFTVSFFEDHFNVSSDSQESHMNREYSYDRYVEAFEWKDAFFIHAGNRKEFVIPKCSITGGTPEELARLLREKLGERFWQEPDSDRNEG